MKQSFNIFKSEINNIIKKTEVYKTAFSKETAVTFIEQEDEQNNITDYECRIECKNGRVAVIRYDLMAKNDFQRWSCSAADRQRLCLRSGCSIIRLYECIRLSCGTYG